MFSVLRSPFSVRICPDVFDVASRYSPTTGSH
jgi:hypothetical protein